MIMLSEEKNKYRQSKEWKEKVKLVREYSNNTCLLCGGKYSGKRLKNLHTHHIHEDMYGEEKIVKEVYDRLYSGDELSYEEIEDLLSQIDLVCLCTTCHRKFVEYWIKKFNSKSFKKSIFSDMIKPIIEVLSNEIE